MEAQKIIKELINTLSNNYTDFVGLYIYSSVVSGLSKPWSDLDILLLFENLDYEKELDIAGIISEAEYKFEVEIDYRLCTKNGKRSIEYIRRYVNPVFVKEAVDNGLYYGRV